MATRKLILARILTHVRINTVFSHHFVSHIVRLSAISCCTEADGAMKGITSRVSSVLSYNYEQCILLTGNRKQKLRDLWSLWGHILRATSRPLDAYDFILQQARCR